MLICFFKDIVDVKVLLKMYDAWNKAWSILADGVCNACINLKIERKLIGKKKNELNKILNKYRNNTPNNGTYHLVSGGKDSTYQVVTAIELNMNPLCVTNLRFVAYRQKPDNTRT